MVDDSELAIAEKALHRAAESAQARAWLHENARPLRRATRRMFLVSVFSGQAAVVSLAALAFMGRSNTELDVGPTLLWGAVFVQVFNVGCLGIWIVGLSKVFVASQLFVDAAASD